MQNSCRENFDELNSEVLSCKKCAEFAELRKTSVHGVGAVNARIIIIGDFPEKMVQNPQVFLSPMMLPAN